MNEMAWYNGKYMALDDVSIPLEDRGFLFGDGVYEVIRIYNRRLFYFAAHLSRLARSSEAIEVKLPIDLRILEEAVLGLIAKSGCKDGYIYMQLTRGVALRNHLAPADINPSLVIYIRELPLLSAPEEREPVKCITVPDDRWLNCHIKAISLLPNILARQAADQAGAVEAIYYRQNNLVTEGSRSNLFAVIDNQVRTHPQSNYILSGITRGIVVDIMNTEGISFCEEAVTLPDLKKATEAWITSTTMELNPVRTIDQERIGNGRKGEIYLHLANSFQKIIKDHCYSN